MIRLSTGAVDKLMGTSAFKTIFNLCFIDVYSGTQPAAPNDVPNGVKLVTVSVNGGGTGLTFETSPTEGVLEKNAGETWSGTILATGQAGWFRMREAGDPGTGSSTTAARVDGTVGTSGADMIVGSVTLTVGAPFVLPACSFTLPKSAAA